MDASDKADAAAYFKTGTMPDWVKQFNVDMNHVMLSIMMDVKVNLNPRVNLQRVSRGHAFYNATLEEIEKLQAGLKPGSAEASELAAKKEEFNLAKEALSALLLSMRLGAQPMDAAGV